MPAQLAFHAIHTAALPLSGLLPDGHRAIKNLRVDVLRLDEIHPQVSGNKWFKLRYYLEDALRQNKKGIVTFGGAWSNHIAATAAACRMNGLSATGIIRGEEPARLSPTLQLAIANGMQLHFVSRSDYRLKKIPDAIAEKEMLMVPEGGYGPTGAAGAATLLEYCERSYTHYCCAAGTGTMLAGLINAVPGAAHVSGFSVLKNNADLENETRALVQRETTAWTLLHEYHFGGYAKYTAAQIQFMNTLFRTTGIPTDFVYTGKLFYGVVDLVRKGYFPAGSELLIIHSGGLQGNASLDKGTLIF